MFLTIFYPFLGLYLFLILITFAFIEDKNRLLTLIIIKTNEILNGNTNSKSLLKRNLYKTVLQNYLRLKQWALKYLIVALIGIILAALSFIFTSIFANDKYNEELFYGLSGGFSGILLIFVYRSITVFLLFIKSNKIIYKHMQPFNLKEIKNELPSSKKNTSLSMIVNKQIPMFLQSYLSRKVDLFYLESSDFMKCFGSNYLKNIEIALLDNDNINSDHFSYYFKDINEWKSEVSNNG